MTNPFRVFATCDIGESINLLRDRGYDVEVYADPQAPPKTLIVEKLRSGIDGLITTLRDQVDGTNMAVALGSVSVPAPPSWFAAALAAVPGAA